MSEKPETVVHVAGTTVELEGGLGLLQRCGECGFPLWLNSPVLPEPWAEGELVGIRIDTTFKDGFVVGFFLIGERELEDDERRCTSG